MESNIKDGSNYLDGVPIKISSKFLPPKPVTIPVAFDTKFSTDLLAEQYDFSLERKVLEHNQRRLLEIETAKEKSAQKSLNSDSEGASSDGHQEHDAKSVLATKQPNAQCGPPWHSNIILQPSPQQLSDKAPSETVTSSTKINLSDFENDTSSPFDYMELQTINDLEELNSVFQGIHGKNVVNGAEDSVIVADASSEDTTVAKSVSFPLSQNQWVAQSEKILSSLSEDFASKLKRASLSGYPTNGPSSYPVSYNSSSTGQMKDYPCDTIGYSTLSQVPYFSSNAGAHTVKESFDKTASLRGSKSYSDISNLSDMEIMNSLKERSRTPPSYSSTLSETVVQPTLSLPEDHFGQALNEPSNGVCNSDNSAYVELDEASKSFVDSLTEMGFAQGQVARAVKHLGTDEKKVVEHLCQIQALEESGYETSEAEAALHLHDYNRDQAKEFLDLVNQFQDLGFEKDAVKKALVQNKNDWNKTIDALLP